MPQDNNQGFGDETSARFLRQESVEYDSVGSPFDLGSFVSLDRELTGTVGDQTGKATVFFSFTLPRASQFQLQLLPVDRWTDRFLQLSLLDSDRRQVQLDASGIVAAQDITNTPIDESIAVLPAGRYTLLIACTQWTSTRYRLGLKIAPPFELTGTGALEVIPTGVITLGPQLNCLPTIYGSTFDYNITSVDSLTLIGSGTGVTIGSGVEVSIQPPFVTPAGYFIDFGPTTLKLSVNMQGFTTTGEPIRWTLANMSIGGLGSVVQTPGGPTLRSLAFTSNSITIEIPELRNPPVLTEYNFNICSVPVDRYLLLRVNMGTATSSVEGYRWTFTNISTNNITNVVNVPGGTPITSVSFASNSITVITNAFFNPPSNVHTVSLNVTPPIPLGATFTYNVVTYPSLIPIFSGTATVAGGSNSSAATWDAFFVTPGKAYPVGWGLSFVQG
jgi:hypothetical protein